MVYQNERFISKEGIPYIKGVKMEGKIKTQTKEANDFAKLNGLVPRKELMEHFTVYINELDDQSFYGLYRILWTLSARKTIIEVSDALKDMDKVKGV